MECVCARCANEPVSYTHLAADVDILTIKSRVFTGEEIIKAWLDTDTLDENCLTVLAQRGTAAVTTTYDTGKQKITVNWNQGEMCIRDRHRIPVACPLQR